MGFFVVVGVFFKERFSSDAGSKSGPKYHDDNFDQSFCLHGLSCIKYVSSDN